MDIESIRQYCLQKLYVSEEFPFDETTLVFKVMGKMFACMPLEKPDMLILKCDADRAIELRDRYSAIEAAWHFNKKHWNDIYFEQLPRKIVEREIRHSYLTVIRENVTPKALREELLAIARKAEIEDAEPIE